MQPQIEESWKVALAEEFASDYFIKLKDFLITEKASYTIYPDGSKIFAAFNYTPFNKVKVVILGQDPYHGEGQAHGLCFSVPHGVKPPPSLVNIYKELNADLGIPIPSHGNLEHWAKQGVLLLNATLTVRANAAGSHQKKGWENFTDAAIKKISENLENVVFLLWGRYAQNKESLIDNNKHLILKTVHPSPLSAYNGFFGCKHFSKTNLFLKSKGIKEIVW
ncbi:MAG: uracil-DNA glycosylase [Bacteroidales bacterium]|nr:uracil-DNA glycosylase [Bacteroidales bacterium]